MPTTSKRSERLNNYNEQSFDLDGDKSTEEEENKENSVKNSKSNIYNI